MMLKSLPLTRTFRLLWWPALAVVLLLVQATLSVTVRKGGILSAYGMITYLLVIVLAAGIATLNAVQSREAIRIFWSFLAMSFGVWSVSAWSWIHSELWFGGIRPAYLVVAAPLFLHIVLMIAAVVSRPHLRLSPQRGYRTFLNFLLLLFFWVFAYALLLVEYPYTSWDAALILRGQALYFAENFLLLVVLGVLIFRAQPPWRSIYWHLLGASALYLFGSLIVNIVFSFRGLYGSLQYIPFTTAAACWFVWVALRGRRLAPQLARSVQPDTGDTKYASLLALMSVIAVPVIGVWELFRADEPYRSRVIRLLIVLVSVFFLTVFAFVKEYLANRELSSDIGLSNERLHLAMEASASVGWDSEVKSGRALWFGDLQGSFGIASNTYAGSVEEFIRYIHPDDRQQVSEAFADARQYRKPYAVEFRIVRADGTVRWLVARGKFYYATNGDPERMLGVSLDITDRKQAEDAVKETEKRYRRIVETANEGVWLLDSNLHTSYVNRQMAEMLGYEAGEMVGRSVLDSYFPEDVEHKKQLLKRRQQGVRAQVEERLRQRDGSELWVRMAATPVFNDKGEFDGALAMVSDITERKRAEEALRESEERLSMAVQAGRMYAFEWDAATDVIVRSGQCVDILNWLEDPMRDTGRQFVARVLPEDREAYATPETGLSPENPIYQTSYRVLRPDGSVIWLEANGRVLFDGQGKMLRIIGLVADVTERKLAEEALSSVSRRLIEAQEQERARIARELHDDLSQRMALLSVSLAQFEENLPDLSSKIRQQAHNIREVAKEVSSNIHNLSHQLHPSKLDTLGLVAAVGGFCRELSDQHELQVLFVHRDIPGQIPKDVTLCLFRIVQEALRNIVKHSGAAEAKVELSGHDDRIDLCVSDSGAGFSIESANGDAGLGLISMRERVRLVRGHFSVESELSHGTRIRVRVPLFTTREGVTSEEKANSAGA
jgi:PAS domain S-box-containing protein